MCHFELWFYQGICLVVGLLGHMVLLFLVNWWLSSKNLPAMQVTWVQSLDWEDPPEEDMATHSSIFAWRIPRTERPGGL